MPHRKPRPLLMLRGPGADMRNVILLTFALVGSAVAGLAGAQAIAGVPELGKLLQGPGFDAEVQRQQQRNAGVAATVSTSMPAVPQSWLSTVNQRGGELRYGNHNVVSKDGEKTVWLIRSMATATASQRVTLTQELQLRVAVRQPEALNFMGFAAEHGVFGVARDLGRAMDFYRTAARAGYQPAIYNLALASAYGRKAGDARDARPDLEQAAALLDRAASVAPDVSSRVCGMGAFVNFRRRATADALRLANGCGSPLAALPREQADTTLLTPQRLEALRRAAATGVRDAYVLLEEVTRRNAQNDPQYLYCKYALLNRYRQSAAVGVLRDAAGRCYDSIAQRTGAPDGRQGASTLSDITRRDQVIDGIANFVPVERAALEALRTSSHFHYGWGVPYLPFAQAEVDLFEPIVSAGLAPSHTAERTSSFNANKGH